MQVSHAKMRTGAIFWVQWRIRRMAGGSSNAPTFGAGKGTLAPAGPELGWKPTPGLSECSCYFLTAVVNPPHGRGPRNL